MTADRLRQAASLLRERAEAATPGRWAHCYTTRGKHWVEGPGEYSGYDDTVATGTSPVDATYIATMAPPVALALADWLDDIAVVWTNIEDMADQDGDPLTVADSMDSHALAVAEAILGPTA